MRGLTTGRKRPRRGAAGALGAGILFLLMPGIAAAQPETGRPDRFRLEEATIAEIHRAIKDRGISCRGLVQAYVDRARAYNGACTQLVTLDGASIAAASGPVRAGSPVRFPTATVPVAGILPDFDRYAGVPLDLGRMEPTASDPTVQAQFGMVAGVPNAGQVNALSTLNLRGERSVACRGGCDAHPSTGELPGRLSRRLRRVPAVTPTPSSGRRSSTRSTAPTPIWPGCRCTAFPWPSRTSTTRRTCGRPRRRTSTSPWMRPPPTRPSSTGCGRRAPSFTPRPTRPSSTAASGTPADPPPRPPGIWAMRSGARGEGRPATPTTPSARPGARAPGRASRSPRTSSPAPSASRRGDRARGRRPATAWSAC